MHHDLTDHLKSLHTAAVDARHGYEEALHDADLGDMGPLFREMIAVHGANGDELAVHLRSRGEEPDEEGSFMSTIHRTIMDIRSLFGGLDESVLSGLIDGEERNVARYEKAAASPDATDQDRALISRQRSVLEAAITKMRALKSNSGS